MNQLNNTPNLNNHQILHEVRTLRITETAYQDITEQLEQARSLLVILTERLTDASIPDYSCIHILAGLIGSAESRLDEECRLN